MNKKKKKTADASGVRRDDQVAPKFNVSSLEIVIRIPPSHPLSTRKLSPRVRSPIPCIRTGGCHGVEGYNTARTSVTHTQPLVQT